MCKKNAKGLRLFKGLNQKTFGTKVTKYDKITPRGVSNFKTNRTKRPSAKKQKEKYPRKDRNMDARKGGDVFPSNPSASITRSPQQKEQNPPKTTAHKKGGRRFLKNSKFPRVASVVNK